MSTLNLKFWMAILANVLQTASLHQSGEDGDQDMTPPLADPVA